MEITEHQNHQPSPAPERPRTPYERLERAVAERNDVIARHARELGAAESAVADALSAVQSAAKAPARRGRRRSS